LKSSGLKTKRHLIIGLIAFTGHKFSTTNARNLILTFLRLSGFGDFRKKKTAVSSCLTNALAPPLIALESCSTAQTDRPV